MVDPDVITALHDFRSTFQHSVFAHQFQVKTPDEFHDFVCSMLGPQQMDAHNIKSLTESVQLGESIVVWNGCCCLWLPDRSSYEGGLVVVQQSY